MSAKPSKEILVRSIHAIEILDSRGTPTIEVTVCLSFGEGKASVPSGKSTGRHEALELRDRDQSRYWGAGVRQAVAGVNKEIAPALVGKTLRDQLSLDSFLRDLDHTPNKERLGANAILGVSLASARARAAANQVELVRLLSPTASLLPVPFFNVINGGAHSDNALEFQEFMIAPIGAPTFAEALRAGAESYHALAKTLKREGLSTAVGDEGGFAPAIATPIEALDLLVRAISDAGYKPGSDISIGLDPAASGFHKDGQYHFGGNAYSAVELTTLYAEWADRYPIVSIEDGLAEDDYDGWIHLTRELGAKIQLVGDDIFVSSAERVASAVSRGIANAVLLKPNQVGTLTEITEASEVAHAAGYRTMMSHRSGETADTFIADLAVALGCGQIKAGAPARGERVAKYNRLLEIEEHLGRDAVYAGQSAFAGTHTR
jgi:enolase